MQCWFNQEDLRLRKAQDIIGLPVIEIETGKQVGTVKDFLIDHDWHLQGVLLETNIGSRLQVC